MNRVLITGAGGFIGSHLARTCLGQGYNVVAISRPGPNPDRLSGIQGNIRIEKINLTERRKLGRLFEDFCPNVVFHLANTTRIKSHDSPGAIRLALIKNLGPLNNVVSAALSCSNPPNVLVRTGSIAEYGNISVPFSEVSREEPSEPYGLSLLAGTHYLRALQSKLPFRAVTARLALTYGPGQTGDFLVPSLIEALYHNRSVVLRRKEDRRDLIHVDDVVAALLKIALHAQDTPSLVNVSTGVSTKTIDVARTIAELIGAKPGLIKYEAPTVPSVELRSDNTLLRNYLDWNPIIDVSEGLQRTIAWYQSHKLLRS